VDVTEGIGTVLDTNLKAHFSFQAAGKEMIKKNGGKSSISPLRPA
jgi:hypothetical protein